MQVLAIKTPRVEFNDNIDSVLDILSPLNEKTIVAITSKIISFCEGRYVSKKDISKRQLIEQEADEICDLHRDDDPFSMCLTIKNNLLIPSAGIDESNANDSYILYPKNVWDSAAYIWNYLKEKNQISDLGIIITDSHTTMMRSGVTGIALSWCGFKPVYSYVNKPDLYGRPLQFTQVNIVDALAVSAVFAMGEGNEQTPIAILTNVPHIKFTESIPTLQDIESINISKDEDLYGPLLNAVKWTRGNN